MHGNTLNPGPSAPFNFDTDAGRIYVNPSRETLGNLVAEHARLNAMRMGDSFAVGPFEMPDFSGTGFTISTYVDRDASEEPAHKVFPYVLGNEAVAVEKVGGGKIAFAALPAALRRVLKPGKDRSPRETLVVKVRAHSASRNYKITESASGLHIYRDFDEAPGKWHLEGSAPGVPAAEWEKALHQHVYG